MKNCGVNKYYGDQQRPALYFFNPIGRFGAFDNFYPCHFKLDGQYWRSVEHYFQAQKHAPQRHAMRRVQLAFNGAAAKQRGRSIIINDRQHWEAVRYAVMYRALWAKFTQNPHLQKILLSTGSLYLVEHNPDDTLWGCGKDKTGQNLMGQALMQVRRNLQRRLKTTQSNFR